MNSSLPAADLADAPTPVPLPAEEQPRLLVDVHQNTAPWAVKLGNDVLERGLAKSLEEIRSIQLAKHIGRVLIDGMFHTHEVTEAAFEFGWEVYKGRSTERMEIEEATDSNFLFPKTPSLPLPTAHYVAGFMFDATREQVALIRKLKPVWQRGKLNGIGGKVEFGEAPAAAMVREFQEETGWETTIEQWERFLEMGGKTEEGEPFTVDFYATVGDLTMLQSVEAEQVEILYVNDIHANRRDMIENLPWLVPLALDYLHDGRPGFVRAFYHAAA